MRGCCAQPPAFRRGSSDQTATPFHLPFSNHLSIMSSPKSSPSRAPLSTITNDSRLLSSPTRGKRRASANVDEDDTTCKRLRILQQPQSSKDDMEVDEEQSTPGPSSIQLSRRPGLYGIRHALRMGDAAARRTIARKCSLLHAMKIPHRFVLDL